MELKEYFNEIDKNLELSKIDLTDEKYRKTRNQWEGMIRQSGLNNENLKAQYFKDLMQQAQSVYVTDLAAAKAQADEAGVEVLTLDFNEFFVEIAQGIEANLFKDRSLGPSVIVNLHTTLLNLANHFGVIVPYSFDITRTGYSNNLDDTVKFVRDSFKQYGQQLNSYYLHDKLKEQALTVKYTQTPPVVLVVNAKDNDFENVGAKLFHKQTKELTPDYFTLLNKKPAKKTKNKKEETENV